MIRAALILLVVGVMVGAMAGAAPAVRQEEIQARNHLGREVA